MIVLLSVLLSPIGAYFIRDNTDIVQRCSDELAATQANDLK